MLEGTYPYAIGGVSSWVDGLVRSLPEVRFGIAHLYAGEAPKAVHFERPNNVVWQRDLRLPDALDALDPDALAAQVPDADVIHALSTGFAGLVGAAASRQRGAPLVVTEHGVYWHEVEQGSPELETGLRLAGLDASAGNACASRALWVRRFKEYARRAYAAAAVVTTVTAANVPLQRRAGAGSVEVIPNGVAPPDRRGPLLGSELARLHPSARRPATARIGLIGRVAPLKDVHAFVRAAAAVLAERPDVRAFVVGPQDDPAYADSCRALARRLGIEERLHWTGPQPATLWHRHLDLVVLTSRSEAEPLVLLEAMAHGTPVVAPDVGGCAALIAGGGLPPAGRVVRASGDVVRDLGPPTAAAVLDLLADPLARQRAGAAGRQRVARRTVAAVAERYAALYAGLRAGSQPCHLGSMADVA